MDRDTRSLLANTTQALRRGLEEEFALQLEGRFDVLRDGSIAGGPGPQLDDAEKFTRRKIVEAIQHRRATGESDKTASTPSSGKPPSPSSTAWPRSR